MGHWWMVAHAFMMKAGREVVERMQARVVAELTTTFASSYSDRISLAESVTRQRVLSMAFVDRSEGIDYLLNSVRI